VNSDIKQGSSELFQCQVSLAPGKSVDEALKKFQVAFELRYKNAEEWEKERTTKSSP